MLPCAVAMAQPEADPVDTLDAAEDPGAPVPVSPFLFSGSSRVYGQIANRRGTFQETPDDFARFELSPTASFYNVPFTLNVLLSTEQSTGRQNINSISFDLDYRKLEGTLLQRAYDKLGELDDLRALSEAMGGVEKLRDSLTAEGTERVRDLERLKEYADLERLREKGIAEGISKLDELGLVAPTEKFFANFPALSVGVTYPSYTSLTLNSVPVTGANIEWNPGKFYIAAAGGKTQRAIRVPGRVDSLFSDSVRFTPSYNRSLYAARIGFGKKEGGHLIFTGLYATDDPGSLPTDSTGQLPTPSANYVLGLDVNIPIVEDYFTILGEAAGSILTGDIAAADIESNDIPDFIRTTFDPNISSLIDYAFSVKSILRIPETDTRLTGTYRFIGPVFFSLGVPTLRNDNVRYEGRLEQRFLRRQITATAFYRNEEDNLYPNLKTASARLSSFGVGLGLNFRNYPYLRLEYSPFSQRYPNVADGGDIENTTTIFSAMAGYYYKLLGLNAGTNLSFSSQQSESYLGLSDYGVSTITANQSVNFQFPLAFTLGFSSSQLAAAGDTSTRIISVDLSGSYTAFDIWSSSLGFTLADQDGQDSNVGFYIGSSVMLWDAGVFDLRAEKNVYKNLLVTTSNFDEFILTATFTTTW